MIPEAVRSIHLEAEPLADLPGCGRNWVISAVTDVLSRPSRAASEKLGLRVLCLERMQCW